jgi:hypothetical protein
MAASSAGAEAVRERFLAELSEAALEVVSRAGLKGSSVDHEIELWRALGDAVRKDRFGARRDDSLADLTEAAYRVALRHGFRGSFLALELDLWKALCRAMRGSCFTATAVRSLRGSIESLCPAQPALA